MNKLRYALKGQQFVYLVTDTLRPGKYFLVENMSNYLQRIGRVRLPYGTVTWDKKEFEQMIRDGHYNTVDGVRTW